MTQQRGMKRARKVLKRQQTKVRIERKNNIKQAIYAFEKAMKANECEDKNCTHEGHKHE